MLYLYLARAITEGGLAFTVSEKQSIQTSGTVYRRGSGLIVPASLAGVLLQRKRMHQTMIVWRQELLRPFSNSLCYDSILSFNCTLAFHVAFV